MAPLGLEVLQLPIVVSILYYSIVVVLGKLMQVSISKFLPQEYQPLGYDFAATFQVLACSLENSQIRYYYGDLAYFAVLFGIAVLCKFTIKEGWANPNKHFLQYLTARATVKTMCTHIAVQLMGAVTSYQFANIFWSMELTELHAAKFRRTSCRSALSVHWVDGFFIEGLGSIIDTLIWLNTFTNYNQAEIISKCFLGALITVVAIDLTGMCMNPMKAIIVTFGCEGSTIWQDFLVYWVSNFLGVAAAANIYSTSQRMVPTH